MSDQSPIVAPLDTPKGTRWRIRVIQAGLSGNGNYYPPEALNAAVPLFDGVRVFVKGDKEHLAGAGKDFRNLIGRLTEPAFVTVGGADEGEVQATLELLQTAGDIAAKVMEAWQRGMTDIFGFSIDATATAKPAEVAGRKVKACQKIEKVASVDLIIEPGAGGQIINIIEARGTPMSDFLTSREIPVLINAARLPQAAKVRLTEALKDRTDLTEDDLSKEIDRERAYIANFSDSGKVTGLGGRSTVEVRLIEGQDEKFARMLDAFFDPADNSVISIRECYVEMTGDKHVTGLIRNCDPVRLREALNSQSWGDVLGDALTRRMVADYRLNGVYDVWKNLVNIVPVNDFRTQERTRFGGYGDLPEVPEGDPYMPLTSPTDEVATYAVSKKGGTEELTLEMITNDDVGAVRQIPIKLSRAAKRTLCKFVLNHLRTNPVIYDDKTLFHADHGNLGSAALAAASVAAGRLAMKAQAELDSNERLGIGPRFLWVPDGLEETAVDLFRRNTNQDKSFLQSLSLDVVPVWYWTDANDWCLSADPMDIPTIELGFLFGDQEPALFIQDSPSAGSMFTHDKVTYKIRHIYGATVMDFRGMYKSVVA